MSVPRFPEGVGNVGEISPASRAYLAVLGGSEPGDLAWVLQDLGARQFRGGLEELGLPNRDTVTDDFRSDVHGDGRVSLSRLHAAIIHLEGHEPRADRLVDGGVTALYAGAAVAATVLKTGAQAIKRAAPALNGAANIVLAPAEVARSVREERQVGLINAATVYVENNYQIELRDPRQILPFLWLSMLTKMERAQQQLAVPAWAVAAANQRFLDSYATAIRTRAHGKGLFGIGKLYEPVWRRLLAAYADQGTLSAPAIPAQLPRSTRDAADSLQ